MLLEHCRRGRHLNILLYCYLWCLAYKMNVNVEVRFHSYSDHIKLLTFVKYQGHEKGFSEKKSKKHYDFKCLNGSCTTLWSQSCVKNERQCEDLVPLLQWACTIVDLCKMSRSYERIFRKKMQKGKKKRKKSDFHF